MSRITISQETIDKIIELYNSKHLSSAKIALILDLSPQTVTKYLRKAGIEVIRTIKLKLSDIEITKMRRLKDEGYTLAEISKEMNIAVPTISFYTSNYSKGRIWNKDNILKLLLESNFDYSTAAKKVNRKKSNIAFLVKRYGLTDLAREEREKLKQDKIKSDIEKTI